MCNNILELAGSPFTVFTATELYPDPTYDGSFKFQWWHWAIGIAFLAAAVTVTILTSGAMTGTVLSAVHTIAFNAAVTGVTSAIFGTITGGLTYDTDGNVSWSWAGASEGFMWGSISGVVSGALSGGLAGLGNAGNVFGNVNTGYKWIQGAVNLLISCGVYIIRSAITGNFSWENLGTAAVLGFAGGMFGAKYGNSTKGVILGLGIGIIQSALEELMEWIQNLGKKSSSHKYYKLANAI